MTPAEWMAEIGKAAEDLGYGVLRLEPSEIALIDLRTNTEITLETRLLSGGILRELLQPRRNTEGPE